MEKEQEQCLTGIRHWWTNSTQNRIIIYQVFLIEFDNMKYNKSVVLNNLFLNKILNCNFSKS